MTVPAAEKKLTAHDLSMAIAQRYEAPEWHVETELTLDNRRLDVVAFNMWGARQYRVAGFEIKISRGDWMRELAQFQKSEGWMEVVDTFWIVTPPKLVRPDELPAGWGHLELCGSRLMTRAHATQRAPQRVLPRELTARLISRVRDASANAARRRDLEEHRKLSEEIEQRIRSQAASEAEQTLQELQQLRRERAELMAVAGIGPREWGAHEKLMRVARLFAEAQTDGRNLVHRVKLAAEAVGQHHQHLVNALQTMEAL